MSLFHDADICRSIIDSLPAGVCVVDLQKKIVFWSHGAERITGHLRHEVVGHCCIAEAVLHCDQPGCEFCNEDCPVARAIKTSRPAETIGFLQHKDGYEIPVRLRAVPVHNQHGSIIGAAETFEEMQPDARRDRREDAQKLPGCTDEVTDVASPVLMRSHLRQTLATFAEVQVPFGILCLRLEGLQHFRASLGPEAASSLLRVVAQEIGNSLRIAPTPPVASCRRTESGPTRFQIRGFADQRLRKPEAPLAPSNRRISLIVQYVVKSNDEEDATPTTQGERKDEANKSVAPPDKPPAKD